MIMMRTLHRDISKYNQLETAEEAQEETGWKLVHGDVFRPPVYASWLAVFVGTGMQIFSMTLITMLFALLGERGRGQGGRGGWEQLGACGLQRPGWEGV